MQTFTSKHGYTTNITAAGVEVIVSVRDGYEWLTLSNYSKRCNSMLEVFNHIEKITPELEAPGKPTELKNHEVRTVKGYFS